MPLVVFYQYLILFIASLVTYRQYQIYKVGNFNPALVNKPSSSGFLPLLVLGLILMIGLRPMDNMGWQWVDSANYYHSYLLQEGVPFFWDFGSTDKIWDNLFRFWAAHRIGISGLFLLGDALYFGCTYLACKKWFPHDTLAAYIVFLGAFSTYSYSFNGVRAGIAGAIFLWGLAYYEKKALSIFLVLISWGFHHSMQLPVAAYVLTLFFKSPKWYFYGWALCALMAVGHVSFFQNLFASMTDEQGQGYLDVNQIGDFGGTGGFRLDFLLYSAMPVWIGYKLVLKDKVKVSKSYLSLLSMYLCTNAVWMLCMYASYTNRIAYLSWFMYPFVLVYPFLKEDLRGALFLKGKSQYRIFAKVMWYHLAFTLFMDLIFYKFIKG